MRGALADELAGAARPLSQRLGELFACDLGLVGQGADAPGRGDRGRGQAGEGFQQVQIDAGEAALLQRVQGEQAPGPGFDPEHAAQAVVHRQVPVHAFDQAVVGIGQRTVGGKPHRAGRGQQFGQPRMFGDRETPAQGVGGQATDRHRHEIRAIQAQQRGRVAGQQGPQPFKQSTVALVVVQFLGQIGQQRQQGELSGLGHCDSIEVDSTPTGGRSL